MSRCLRWPAAGLVLALDLTSLAAQQASTPIRRAEPGPTALGALSGQVLTLEERGVWGASVILTLPDTGGIRAALTDTQGAFRFVNVPPGRANLSALKSGFAAGGVDQARGEPPLDLVVKPGEAVSGVTIRLSPGAVISGNLTDPAGSALAGVLVSALERREVFGVVRFVRANGAITDDQGRFRIFGLAPAPYVVAASMATFQAAAGGMPPPVEMRMAPQSLPAASAFAHVFAPGTPDPDAAKLVTVRSGEHVERFDFALSATPLGEVSAAVTFPSGGGVSDLQATFVAAPGNLASALGESSGRPVPVVGGRIAQRLQPGKYTLVVRASRALPAQPRDNAARTLPTFPELWFVSSVEVRPATARVLPAIELRIGPPLAGRIVVDKDSSELDLGSLTLRLSPESRRAPPFDLPAIRLPADGRFSIAGPPPGNYYVDVVFPPRSLGRVVSARVGSADLLDVPLTIAGAGVSDLEIVVTTRQTELSGRVVDHSGKPVSNVYLLAFPTDPTRRLIESTRLRPPVRPSIEGQYRIAGLPAGTYLVAALTEWNSRRWMSPDALEQLAQIGARVTIVEGGTTTQDLLVSH